MSELYAWRLADDWLAVQVMAQPRSRSASLDRMDDAVFNSGAAIPLAGSLLVSVAPGEVSGKFTDSDNKPFRFLSDDMEQHADL